MNLDSKVQHCVCGRELPRQAMDIDEYDCFCGESWVFVGFGLSPRWVRSGEDG